MLSPLGLDSTPLVLTPAVDQVMGQALGELLMGAIIMEFFLTNVILFQGYDVHMYHIINNEEPYDV